MLEVTLCEPYLCESTPFLSVSNPYAGTPLTIIKRHVIDSILMQNRKASKLLNIIFYDSKYLGRLRQAVLLVLKQACTWQLVAFQNKRLTSGFEKTIIRSYALDLVVDIYLNY